MYAFTRGTMGSAWNTVGLTNMTQYEFVAEAWWWDGTYKNATVSVTVNS